MLLYSVSEIAQIFGLFHSRLQQLQKLGRGPRHTPTETLKGKKGKPKISTEDALAWGLAQIERLSSSFLTEKDADRYVSGCQRLRVEEWLAQVRSGQQPKPEPLTAKLKSGGRGGEPLAIVPLGFPTRRH
jgi:hypothetical protein